MRQLGSRLRYRASPKTLRTRGQGQIGYAARPQATPTVSHGRSVVPQPRVPALSPGRRNRFTVQGTWKGAAVAREKWLDPSNWASLKPFGIGEQHPNNYLELGNAFRENRDQARYAWRILTQGTCDGCALGTKGMRDWTTRQVHLCNVRLEELLRVEIYRRGLHSDAFGKENLRPSPPAMVPVTVDRRG